MVTQDDIRKALAPRLNRVLLLAEAALAENQFRAFRRLLLDEFGNSGLHKDLEQLFDQNRRSER
jgi:hypothetical protein